MPTRAGDKRAAVRDVAPQSAEELETRLSETLPAAFDQAQSSIASHQKNWVALHKLHLHASLLADSTEDAPRKGKNAKKHALAGLDIFHTAFTNLLNHVLQVKKGSGGGVGERLVKFVAGYIKYINEKGARFDLCFAIVTSYSRRGGNCRGGRHLCV